VTRLNGDVEDVMLFGRKLKSHFRNIHGGGIGPRLHTGWSRLLTMSFYNPSARTTQKTQPLLLRRRVYWSVT
jgi:hypothetical protein